MIEFICEENVFSLNLLIFTNLIYWLLHAFGLINHNSIFNTIRINDVNSNKGGSEMISRVIFHLFLSSTSIEYRMIWRSKMLLGKLDTTKYGCHYQDLFELGDIQTQELWRTWEQKSSPAYQIQTQNSISFYEEFLK